MPTPDRTSLDKIVAAARELLERAGLPGVTMQAVADRVGVRAPSLYKRVDSREGLLRLIAEQTARELGASLAVIANKADNSDARSQLTRMLDAFRAFAHAHPAAYQLIFAPHSGAAAADNAVLAEASAPVLALAAELAGPGRSLSAARTITAWAHGFVTMELSGAFRLGGDVDEAWRFGSQHLAGALAR